MPLIPVIKTLELSSKLSKVFHSWNFQFLTNTFRQISVLSEEIYEKFFKDKIDLTRPVVTKIKEILVRIDKAVTIHNENKSVRGQ